MAAEGPGMGHHPTHTVKAPTCAPAGPVQQQIGLEGRSHHCLTCRLAFTSLDTLKDHYRVDLHRANLKRKVNGLTALTQAQLDAREVDRDAPELQVPTSAPLNARSGKDKHSKKRNKAKKEANRLEQRVAKREQKVLRAQESYERKEALLEAEMAGLEGMTEDEAADHVIAERLRKAPQRGPTQCLFSGEEFETMEEAVVHMAKNYGFYVPDVPYMDDLEGFIDYFKQKAYVGYTCFNCQKMFGGWQQTVQHMVDTCHCVLPYDGTDDEICDYYDWGPAEGEAEPEAEGSDDEEGWEEMDEAESAAVVATHLLAEGTEEAAAGEEGAAGRAAAAQARGMVRAEAPTTSAGASSGEATVDDEVVGDMVQELVLPGGRRAGHRSLARYYKQSIRPERQEHADLIGRLITSYRGMGYQIQTSRKLGRPQLSRSEKKAQRQTWVKKQHMEFKLSFKQNKINVGPRGSGWNPRYGAEAFL